MLSNDCGHSMMQDPGIQDAAGSMSMPMIDFDVDLGFDATSPSLLTQQFDDDWGSYSPDNDTLKMPSLENDIVSEKSEFSTPGVMPSTTSWDLENALSALMDERVKNCLCELSAIDIFGNHTAELPIDPPSSGQKTIYISLKSNEKVKKTIFQLCPFLIAIRESRKRSTEETERRNQSKTSTARVPVKDKDEAFRHKQKCDNELQKYHRENMVIFYYNEIRRYVCRPYGAQFIPHPVPAEYDALVTSGSLNSDDKHAIDRIIITLRDVYQHFLYGWPENADYPGSGTDEGDALSMSSYTTPTKYDESTSSNIVCQLQQLTEDVRNLRVDLEEHAAQGLDEAHVVYSHKKSRGSPSNAWPPEGMETNEPINTDHVVNILRDASKSMTWKEIRDAWITTRRSREGVEMTGKVYNQLLNGLVKARRVEKGEPRPNTSLPVYTLRY